jgi:L-ascorbate metabolism protein UlaG (beta-lactamase superfamily)
MPEPQALDAATVSVPDNPQHFRDGRFFNPGVPDQDFWKVLRWMRTRTPEPWPAWIASEPGPAPPRSIAGDDLRVTFINHSTFLLQTADKNILTDPVWSLRVSPVQWTGPKRHRAPGIRFEDLPPIDAVLISHNHYDHFDRPTLRRLSREHQPAVFCPLGLEKPLRKIGFREVCELDWWQSTEWDGIPMHCVPAQHFAARTPFDRNRTLWCGWVVSPGAGNLYFAGDSGFGSFFRQIGERLGPMRLALIPIGAYEPEWFMGPVHMTPEEAVKVHALVRAETTIPIHYGTFSLADDGLAAPLVRLRKALEGHPDAACFQVLEEGEGRLIPGLSSAQSIAE